MLKAFIVLSFVVTASAQVVPSTGATTNNAVPKVAIISGGPVGVSSGFGFTSAFGGTTTGAPYSGEEVTEHVQTLADGTHINQPSPKTKIFRDSQGRTRTERTFGVMPGGVGQPPSMIEIFDAVSGVRYTLDPRSHTARKMSIPAPPPPPPPPSGSTGSRVTRILPAIVPAPQVALPDIQAERPQFSREALGTQTIEGVLAEGSRMTVTYPIGAVGNDRPITTTSETWTSPELNTVVLSKQSDPRSGESTTRLTNVSRAEPDPALFQIPADYEVAEQ